jgi:hypothetical protein
MRQRLLNALGWTIGPTIWISSVVLMIHGLWTGAWYGYIFAAILLATLGAILLAIYRANRVARAEFERRFREWRTADDFNSD